MRLLHTSTLSFHEFLGDYNAPSYAILSHTWEEEEVSYCDFLEPESRKLKGYEKIKSCCDLAASEGFEYVWIDTCCIDKKNSAELSEAINSMHKWYRNAEICYVYLADISVIPNKIDEQCMDDSGNGAQPDTCSSSVLSESSLIGQEWAEHRKLVESRWFTRGWTLQELLAPRALQFYDKNWMIIGTEVSLADQISTAAGFIFPPTATSIAAKMSWASKRQTTRPEDVAYCLLGLFDVNMPLLYGEGDKAFLRLQQEIIKSSNDQSIFAWKRDDSLFSGMLAHSPADFQDSADVMPCAIPGLPRSPYSITNLGLEIELAHIRKGESQSTWPVILSCVKGPSLDESQLVLLDLIEHDGHSIEHGGHIFDKGWSRVFPDRLRLIPKAQMAAAAAQAQSYESRLFRIRTFQAPHRPERLVRSHLNYAIQHDCLLTVNLSPAAQARLTFVKHLPCAAQPLWYSGVKYAENHERVVLEPGYRTCLHYTCGAEGSALHVVVGVSLNLPSAEHSDSTAINRIEALVAVQSNLDLAPAEWLTNRLIPCPTRGLTWLESCFSDLVYSSSAQDKIGRTLVLPMGNEGVMIVKSRGGEGSMVPMINVDIDVSSHALSSIL